MKKFFFLLLAPVILAGCNSVSNLTPTKAVRNHAGLYHVETKFSTTKTAIIDDSIKGYVVSGTEVTPLERVPLVKDRWEGEVRIPASQMSTHFHFQFDYKVNNIPKATPGAFTSPEYGLDLIER